MSLAGHNFPISLPVFLGTLNADGTKPSVHFPKLARLVGVKLMNGANLAASDDDFFDLKLKLGSQVLANYNNKESEQGALAANVASDFALTDERTLIPGGSDLHFELDEFGGQQEFTRIVCTAEDANTTLDEKYFLLHDEDGSVAFWFDVGGGASIPSGADSADRAVEITTVTASDNAATVADKVATAINGDSKFSAVVSAVEGEEAHVIVTASAVGLRDDASDGLEGEGTGFEFSVETQGAEVSDITLTNAQAVLIYYPL